MAVDRRQSGDGFPDLRDSQASLWSQDADQQPMSLRESPMKSGIRNWFVILTVATPALALAGDGLSVREDVWPVWQARLSLTAVAPGLGAEMHARPLNASLLGDYYFGVPRLLPLSSQGGLRATSGVIASTGLRPPQSPPMMTEATDAAPYLGLGYTHSALGGGWGFTADIGVVAHHPGAAWRTRRALLGDGPAMDDAISNLRLSPIVQLGVRYRF
jgi:hypothetical protein